MIESPILIKTYDFLKWLMQTTEKFPKTQRFVLAQRLQQTSFQFYELLVEARRVRPNDELLARADMTLEKLRTYLRLSHELGLLPMGPYRHASQSTTEIGRLLGGWIKQGPEYAHAAVRKSRGSSSR